jgi:hypothetical protein
LLDCRDRLFPTEGREINMTDLIRRMAGSAVAAGPETYAAVAEYARPLGYELPPYPGKPVQHPIQGRATDTLTAINCEQAGIHDAWAAAKLVQSILPHPAL